MLTTDFTGTYDYEKEEALHEANYLLECLQENYFTADELPERIERTRNHWRKALNDSESFSAWDGYFLAAIEVLGVRP